MNRSNSELFSSDRFMFSSSLFKLKNKNKQDSHDVLNTLDKLEPVSGLSNLNSLRVNNTSEEPQRL